MSNDQPRGAVPRRRSTSRSEHTRAAWTRLTTPRPSGLPNLLVLSWFPIVVVLGLVVLVALGVNGSSTGVFWGLLGQGPDPHLISGTPRPIRSDEWLVQSSWLVSQVSQGYPATNHVFPGGMDATVMNDLPSWEWSTLFRPHTWGFLVLGLDRGMAVRWWLPAAAMLIATYTFVVSMLPRRPALGALLALLVLFQPLVQWWWLPIVPLPVAFAFSAMGAVVWAVRARSLRVRLVPAVVAAYLAVDMAMSIYVPFMLPAVISLVAFTVGFVLVTWRGGTASPLTIARDLVPLAAAAVAAGGVLLAWVASRRDTVEALLATVYPGQRLTPPGSSGRADLVSLLSGPFQRSLQVGVFDGIGGNQSEASSVLLVSLFLAAAVVALLVRQRRREHSTDWLLVSVVLAQVVVLAYLFVPGWDALAHLTGLDRAVPQRMRLFFVMMGVVVVVSLVHHLDQRRLRVPWAAAVVSAGTAVAASAWVWHELAKTGSPVVPSVYTVLVVGLLAAGTVVLCRRHAAPGVALMVIGGIVVSGGVNPLYQGVFDLRNQTKAGRSIQHISQTEPDATWVGVGSFVSLATLVESGVHAYNGVQTYPSTRMWDDIDPTGAHEQQWNRLAHVTWVGGGGDPFSNPVVNPSPDQIVLAFDSCAPFAQEHVDYVLADGLPLLQPCVQTVRRIDQNSTHEWIYKVVAPPT